jgi:hypothetical protein
MEKQIGIKMKTYKIWTYIEEHDTETDEYVDLDEPLSIAEYKTLEEAENYREMLKDTGVFDCNEVIK